ncbi:MAG: hypothetical protein WB919_18535 [Candidatus Sulfotelmatobacter sp.]
MLLGAVVAVGSNNQWCSQDSTMPLDAAGDVQKSLLSEPLECVEIAGRSLAERIVEGFTAVDMVVAVLVESGTSLPRFRAAYQNVTVEVVRDLSSAISQKLSDFSQQGIDHAFVNCADTFAETDLLDLFCFHRESRQRVTPTCDQQGSLALWVVDCAKAEDVPVETLLHDARSNAASRYFIREYTTRLNDPRDLRQFASDMLRGRCQTGPSGREVRPGVWIDEDVEIHRRARIVAPAYIGSGSKIKADALITRFSNVERDSCIDCGTVVEDSSILAGTTVGIWLDMCHAIASGNRLLNLERNVLVEISDPKVLRSSSVGHKFVPSASGQPEPLQKVSDLQEARPIPGAWQLGSNLIQE